MIHRRQNNKLINVAKHCTFDIEILKKNLQELAFQSVKPWMWQIFCFASIHQEAYLNDSSLFLHDDFKYKNVSSTFMLYVYKMPLLGHIDTSFSG